MQNDQELPSWADPRSGAAGEAMFETLMELGDYSMYSDFYGLEERRLGGGPIVKQVLQNMHDALQHPQSTPKAILYSAHDSTLAAFLDALQVVLGRG